VVPSPYTDGSMLCPEHAAMWEKTKAEMVPVVRALVADMEVITESLRKSLPWYQRLWIRLVGVRT
jgi:hypothetical protein